MQPETELAATRVRILTGPRTELAATLVRILTGPRTDVERRDVRRIERFIRNIVKQELKDNA